MFVDLIGINSIAHVIEQSGLSRFIIYKANGTLKSTPVFENLNCESNKEAKLIFINWANAILSGNPTNCNEYELFLFTSLEDAEGPDLEGPDLTASGKPRRSKIKSNKIKFSFALCNQNAGASVNGPEYKKEDIASLINDAIQKRDDDKTNNEVLKRLTELENKLTMDDDDDDDDDELGEDAISKITKVITQLQGLGINLGLPKKENSLAVVNGPDDVKPERNVMGNINKAIKILYKNNTQLDLDLLKLADLSETNPSQFNFLINALRKM